MFANNIHLASGHSRRSNVERQWNRENVREIVQCIENYRKIGSFDRYHQSIEPKRKESTKCRKNNTAFCAALLCVHKFDEWNAKMKKKTIFNLIFFFAKNSFSINCNVFHKPKIIGQWHREITFVHKGIEKPKYVGKWTVLLLLSAYFHCKTVHFFVHTFLLFISVLTETLLISLS